jgi:hypothetical protein
VKKVLGTERFALVSAQGLMAGMLLLRNDGGDSWIYRLSN